MLGALTAAVDRRIARVIVSRARRRWLALRLVPAAWIQPVVKPAATGIRRELSRTAVTVVAIAGPVFAVLLLLGGL
jgi:hypothetical protein